MLDSIAPQNTSSKSTFAWIKELLARGEHEIISSDDKAELIETEHAIFIVIEKGDEPKFERVAASFANAIKKNKNFAILAPDLADTAINAINACDFLGTAAMYHRKDVIATKVRLSTSEMTIKRAISEMTQVNKALQAFGKIYKLQDKYFLFGIAGVASLIEDIAHAPAVLQTPTLCVLFSSAACNCIVWIAGRRRIMAARRGVTKLPR